MDKGTITSKVFNRGQALDRNFLIWPTWPDFHPPPPTQKLFVWFFFPLGPGRLGKNAAQPQESSHVNSVSWVAQSLVGMGCKASIWGGG